MTKTKLVKAAAIAVLCVLLARALAGAPEFEEFGIESVGADASTTAAAAHPDFTTSFTINPPKPKSGGARLKDAIFELPPGIYGNPNLVERCSTGDLVGGDCPVDSQVGVSSLRLRKSPGEPPGEPTVPVFNMEPPHPEMEVARFGMSAVGIPIFIDVSVRTAGDYGITAGVYSANADEALEGEKRSSGGTRPTPATTNCG